MDKTTAQVNIASLLDGETGFLLDGSYYVAVSVEIKRDATNSWLSAKAHARLVNVDGSPVHDAHDQPVEAWHTYSVPADSVNDDTINGQAGIAREAVLLVLGDDDALGDMDDNIRHAIEAAAITGPVDLSTIDFGVPKA